MLVLILIVEMAIAAAALPNASCDPPLKPNHPNHKIKVPKTAKGKLEPVNFPLFASEYFPILGPKIKTADKAIHPPTE